MDLRYIGHAFQVFGVQRYTLEDGKGRGMRFLHIKNGIGLEMHISIDRACDIAGVSINGKNVSYMCSNGFVAPSYYDDKGAGFLKSFSAGFLTTCGLTQVGSPNLFEGKELPLHGTISHIPASAVNYWIDDEKISIEAVIEDETIFSHKLVLHRSIVVSTITNQFSVEDRIENRGEEVVPLQLLYHINLGYPLICEKAELRINSSMIEPRDDVAKSDIKHWSKIEAPAKQYVEKCYYHHFTNHPEVSVYNPSTHVTCKIDFDHKQLPYLTQWKMFKNRDYVLGLEPGNCFPDGCKVSEEKGRLSTLEPSASKSFKFIVHLESSEA